MKRGLSNINSSIFSAKRRRVSSPPPSNPSTQTLAPTRQDKPIRQDNLQHAPASIQDWLDNCIATPPPDMSTAPPTPRSASAAMSRGRGRITKRPARTPSPSKKPLPQTYRTRNMYHAGVLVDYLADLPPAVDDAVRQILGLASVDDPVQTDDPQLTGLAATFLADSRRNARECLLEGDWKATLNILVRTLADSTPATLRTHMSEKVWNADLKPTANLVPEELQDNVEDTSGARTPSTASMQYGLLDTDSGSFNGPIPSLPPDSYSVTSTTTFEAADPYHISTPKPDITVGLAHTAFTRRHQRRLVDHQAAGSILSDPHAADMGVRFPFLVVEAKGLSVNGSLVSAQNQSAICGASMLRILKDLDSQTPALDPGPPSSTTPALCFSVVTEGPVHELWVHFHHDGAVHMVSLRSWRTTHTRSANELVLFLARIMDWGRGAFRDGVVQKLDNIPGHVRSGF